MHKTRFTIGSDRIDYDGYTVAFPTTLTTMKLHLKITISTRGARHATLDIKDFYSGTPMERKDYEYAQMTLSIVPEEIIRKCGLKKISYEWTSLL